ncbi:hypothetical protein HDU92_005604 [Lobulomyces angularis]|nr:hypothetical protein HDU92_005604 [Lobulomyces angularis]
MSTIQQPSLTKPTKHSRSVSSLPNKQGKHSRRPTAELLDMKDEGYESMPTILGSMDDASVMGQQVEERFDRIADIEDDDTDITTELNSRFRLDSPPLGSGLSKWKAMGNIVTNIANGTQDFYSSDSPLGLTNTNAEFEKDADSEDVESEDNSLNDSIHEKPKKETFKQKWNRLKNEYPIPPFIERITSNKNNNENNAAKKSTTSAAKNQQTSPKLSPIKTFKGRDAVSPMAGGWKKKVKSKNDIFQEEEETLEEERSLISEDAPDENFELDEHQTLISQKLFDSKYRESEKQIGTGGHSTVRLATRIHDNKPVVCKFMQASSVWNWYYSKKLQKKIPLEIHLMEKFTKKMNNNEKAEERGLIKFIEYFEMSGKYIIVMEYMGEDWVDLYDYIEMFGPVPQNDSKDIFKSVVQTIDYLHNLGYCHNDIKDENILINTKTREIKLIDFGSTTQLIPGKQCSLFYGTKKFASPEAVGGEPYYPEAQEVWCLGTLLYVLLFKMDPFKDDKEILEFDISLRINRLRAAGRENGGADISDSANEALLRMMNKDWKRRIRSADIIKLDFFKD